MLSQQKKKKKTSKKRKTKDPDGFFQKQGYWNDLVFFLSKRKAAFCEKEIFDFRVSF